MKRLYIPNIERAQCKLAGIEVDDNYYDNFMAQPTIEKWAVGGLASLVYTSVSVQMSILGPGEEVEYAFSSPLGLVLCVQYAISCVLALVPLFIAVFQLKTTNSSA